MLLSHERASAGKSDLLATLQEEILAVIAKHVNVDRDKVQIKLDRGRRRVDAGDRCGGPGASGGVPGGWVR